MQLDAVTIAVIAGVLVALLLGTAASRRRGVDRPDDRGPFSSSTESQAGFAALGTTNPAARHGDDHPAGHDHGHGGGHDHDDSAGGGHSHGGDAGGGGDARGGG